MADLMTIDVDEAALLSALAEMPVSVLRHLKPAAKVTADNIAAEAGRRVKRRTGKTAAGITVEETHNGEGYVIWVKRPEMPNLPLWLAFGTKFMVGDDFLFASARLEAGAHERRAREAVQDAINEQGLGD